MSRVWWETDIPSFRVPALPSLRMGEDGVMNDTPIIIEGTKLTLDQWLRELSASLLKAAAAGESSVCITTELAVSIAREASKYAEVLVERRARKNGN